MVRRPGDLWTASAVDLLKAMADAGHTAADVAVRLGTSRSAVLGKAKRLGIRFSGQAVPVPSKLSIDLGVPGVVMPSGATLILIPGEEPGRARAIEPEPDFPAIPLNIIPDGGTPAYFTEIAVPAELPSPPGEGRATQGEAMEAAPETGPSPVGAASPSERAAKGRMTVFVPHDATRDEVQAIVDASVSFAPASTPQGWPKPAGPNAVSLQDLRAHHCRMPLWGAEVRSGMYCGERAAIGEAYCAACRPLTLDKRQVRTARERDAAQAKLSATGRSGAFA